MSFNKFLKTLLIFTILTFSGTLLAQEEALTAKDSLDLVNLTSEFDLSKHYTPDIKTVILQTESVEEADNTLAEYLTDNFPLISEKAINDIASKKSVEPLSSSNSEGSYNVEFYEVSYEVPINFFVDTAKILWELNIPEFKSRIYQLYNGDTIYIDTWNNVVGTASNKTYTGYFEAFKLRNWPSWKDPEKGKEHLPAKPPGPNNPLGLFVVHYDENSLRYFHGTNKNHLLDNARRNLSHGCVRNKNENIQKMKEFIIEKVVKADDLTYWLDSKKSMEYFLEEQDKFPVRIIYKTFNIDVDDYGSYIELFDDIYGYSNPSRISTQWNDVNLITLTTKANIIDEFRKEIGMDISKENLDLIADYLLNKTKKHEKYYLKDLMDKFMMEH
ncbi:MAG: L,D-transpeptidase [Ignavibacteria bacterium]|nr:L,D-transpeptidase [Ignavibacteria bacterium]